MEHPQVGSYRGMQQPIRFGRTPGERPFAAPTFGQHTEAVLLEQGWSAAEIDVMRRTGAIG